MVNLRQALDDMFAQAVLELKSEMTDWGKRIETSNKDAKDKMDERLKAQDGKQKWLIGIASLIAVLLAIIALAQTGVLPSDPILDDQSVLGCDQTSFTPRGTGLARGDKNGSP